MDYRLQLQEDFSNIKYMPIFEINLAEYLDLNDDEDEYVIFYLNASLEGIEAGGCSNTGWHRYSKKDLFIEWEEYYSLDWHLEGLFECCVNYAITEYLKEIK